MKGPNDLFSRLRIPGLSISGFPLIFFLGTSAAAQAIQSESSDQPQASARGAIEHAQKMRVFRDVDIGSQSTPGVIPRFGEAADPAGRIGTFQPGGPTFTQFNAFFQNLGTNGRTCFTCHQPQDGWSVSAADISARFQASRGNDPIFRLVDGAACPTSNVSTPRGKREAYKLLINKGLIRIGLPLPQASKLQFEVIRVDDPYNCTTNPATGLTSPVAGIVSVYRRPLPSTNLKFLSAIMWDGRESDLRSQAADATLGHAQANVPPTKAQLDQIVAFETGIFTAQEFDRGARILHDPKTAGGPRRSLRRQFLHRHKRPVRTESHRRGLRPEYL
jgi:hypothetical protein